MTNKLQYPAHACLVHGLVIYDLQDQLKEEFQALLDRQQADAELLNEARELAVYCSNMALNGMASHRDAIHGKCIHFLAKLNNKQGG